MRLLLKIILFVFAINAIGVLGTAGQRIVRETHLESLLSIDETCGQDCWFQIPPDGSIRRRQIEQTLSDLGMDTASSRGQRIRFLLYEDSNAPSVGTLQFELIDGYAIETCVFPSRDIALSDIVSTFGTPSYFWIDLDGSRLLTTESNYFYPYEMRFESPDIIVIGEFRLDTTESDARLSFNTPVTQFCTPIAIQETNRPIPSQLIAWQGFYTRVETYMTRRMSEQIDDFGFTPNIR